RHMAGADSELKESLIGVEVFGRKPDYDPKVDAIVRTEAIRLRARLSKYYANAVTGNELLIELPKGGYVTVFPRAAALREERKTRSPRRWFAAALAGLVAVTLFVVGLRWVQRESAPVGIAVLPLENLEHNPANDYFAEGLTDEIIRNLSVIEGLAV